MKEGRNLGNGETKQQLAIHTIQLTVRDNSCELVEVFQTLEVLLSFRIISLRYQFYM